MSTICIEIEGSSSGRRLYGIGCTWGTVTDHSSPNIWSLIHRLPEDIYTRMAWISNEIIDSVLRHREMGRARDL
jgi:hypothetical protein